MMSISFIINSNTIDITNYTIKDIPGSTGRLDVISRCILSAILSEGGFETDVRIWTFLNNYGALCFDPKNLDYKTFPKDELVLSDNIVKLLKETNHKADSDKNPLTNIEINNETFIEFIKGAMKDKKLIYVLKEEGKNLLDKLHSIPSNQDRMFIIGNQEEDFINSKDFLDLNLPELSLSSKSYLSSTTIRLLKLILKIEVQ